MKTTLFTDRNTLITRSALGGSVDPDRIMPHMYTAQLKHVRPLLGTVLYKKLQDDIESGSVANQYKILLEDYVTDLLIHYTLVEYLPFSLYHMGQGGTLSFQVENTLVPNKKDIDFILQKSLQTAQFFSERLVDYLIANSTEYPEYLDTTGKSDMIYPDKGNQYGMGWVL